MGTNSSTSHQSYLVAPTTSVGDNNGHPVADPIADTVLNTGASAEPDAVTTAPNQPVTSPAPLTDQEELGDPADTSAPSHTEEPDPAPPADESAADTTDDNPGAGVDLLPFGERPVTPIPATPDPGLAHGHPILVGGADMQDSAVTLISYQSAEGPRTVLHAVVEPAAEAQLMDALHLSATEMVPVQTEQAVQGRLPLDEQHHVFEALVAAGKSVNYHSKQGNLGDPDNVPVGAATKIALAEEKLAAAKASGGSEPELQMLALYQQHLDTLHAGIVQGTGVPHIHSYLHEGTAMVTTMVPAPASSPPEGKLVATVGDATRLRATIDPETGSASWNGTDRWTKVNGTEYTVDLQDGYTAVYRPYAANDPKETEYSLRGRLEIIAPPGEGQGPVLVDKLGRLNLTNRPMTRAEGEWRYLAENVAAQSLTDQDGVASAMAVGVHMEDMVRQELFHDRAHQAVGMDGPALAAFAKDIQLEAATKALPAKVGLLRVAVAHATGSGTGAELAASPGYQPTPIRSGGWLTWQRFDVGNNRAKVQAALAGRSLQHSLGDGSLKEMFGTGVMASTERRAMMGVRPGLGQSEDTDKATGGASSVFTRMVKSPPATVTSAKPGVWAGSLVWDGPDRLLGRADYYGADADTYGVVNPAKAKHYGKAAATRDPFTIAAFTSTSNEVMFRNGLDLLGADAPSRVICHSMDERNSIRSLLAAKGITELGGKPIDQVIL